MIVVLLFFNPIKGIAYKKVTRKSQESHKKKLGLNSFKAGFSLFVTFVTFVTKYKKVTLHTHTRTHAQGFSE